MVDVISNVYIRFATFLFQNNMYDLLFELRESPSRFVTMEPGEMYKSWQLVWSEVDDRCSENKQIYNPCKLFT